MPKLKTQKAILKRFKVKKSTKNRSTRFEQIPSGQGHFNGKESGTLTRRKRGRKSAHKSNYKTLKRLLPYSK